MRYLLRNGPWIGVVVSSVWMIAIRPAHSKVLAVLLTISLTLAVGSLFLRMLVGVTRRRNQRIRGIGDAAAAALARDGFIVVDGLLGDRCHDLIAIDDQRRVALCDLGPGGILRRTRIVAADQVQTGSVVTDLGGAVLIVNLAGERREFVFAAHGPTVDDRSDDEQSRIDASVRWWCERLSGRQPTESYQVSHRVGVRAFGHSFDAALEHELVKRGLLSEIPDARVVRK